MCWIKSLSDYGNFIAENKPDPAGPLYDQNLFFQCMYFIYAFDPLLLLLLLLLLCWFKRRTASRWLLLTLLVLFLFTLFCRSKHIMYTYNHNYIWAIPNYVHITHIMYIFLHISHLKTHHLVFGHARYFTHALTRNIISPMFICDPLGV